jgi:hypothetical protein
LVITDEQLERLVAALGEALSADAALTGDAALTADAALTGEPPVEAQT